jgi:hypothetical protein
LFVKPSLRADDHSEIRQLGSALSSLMLAVELAEPFLSPEPVKLLWDDSHGLLVGGPGGGELESRGALRVAETPGDRVQVAVPAARSWVAE